MALIGACSNSPREAAADTTHPERRGLIKMLIDAGSGLINCKEIDFAEWTRLKKERILSATENEASR